MGISADVSQLKSFAARTRKAQPTIYKKLRSEIKDAGEIVRVAAVAKASYSKKIPPGIKSRATGNSVTVTAKGPAIVTLMEGSGDGGSWRHPLFGNRKDWYSEARRPYLHPALRENEDRVRVKIGQAMHDAAVEVVSSG